MERGGFELQVNAVDRETLLRAREEPDRYRDLVVRIGGYSDYFVRLPPQMQGKSSSCAPNMPYSLDSQGPRLG